MNTQSNYTNKLLDFVQSHGVNAWINGNNAIVVQVECVTKRGAVFFEEWECSDLDQVQKALGY